MKSPLCAIDTVTCSLLLYCSNNIYDIVFMHINLTHVLRASQAKKTLLLSELDYSV